VKWIIFAIAVAGVLPLAQWLRRNPQMTTKAWLLFGFLPFAYNPHIALIDWAGWPGYVQGILATGLDLLTLTLFINLPKAKRPAPFRIVMGLYFIAMVASVFQSDVPMASMFYPWQLLKVYFVFIVVRRASSDEHVLDAIFTGMMVALCFEVVVAGWQRLGHDVLRAEGSFGDKNLLGFITEFAIFTPFALLLAGRRSWLTTIAPIAGVLIAILTASRAALGFSAIGLTLVFLMSSWRSWTPKKKSVLFRGLVVVALLSPVAWSSLQERFAQEPTPAADERAIFNRAAEMILSDHPFGRKQRWLF